MSGGGDQQTTTQSPRIPDFLKGPSKDIVSQLMSSLFPGGNFQQYNSNLNQNVAGFSPLQQQSFQGAQQGFGGAQQTVQGAQGANQLLTNPNMLYADSNPYLQSNVNSANQQITDAYRYGVGPSEMSQAVMTGAFGGSGDAVQRLQNQFSLARSIGQTDASMYGQNYENQLNVMNSASQGAGGVAGANFIPSQQLNQFGGQQQQQQQNVLNTNTSNAWQQQNFPYQLLQQAGGILSPYLGAFSGTTTVSPNLAPK